jgi:hypothetical protein
VRSDADPAFNDRIDNPVVYIHDPRASIKALYIYYHLEKVMTEDELYETAIQSVTHPDLLNPSVNLDELVNVGSIDRGRIEQQRDCRFCQLPKEVILILVTCCFGAMTQGFGPAIDSRRQFEVACGSWT